jgi:hypothetical protein
MHSLGAVQAVAEPWPAPATLPLQRSQRLVNLAARCLLRRTANGCSSSNGSTGLTSIGQHLGPVVRSTGGACRQGVAKRLSSVK